MENIEEINKEIQKLEEKRKEILEKSQLTTQNKGEQLKELEKEKTENSETKKEEPKPIKTKKKKEASFKLIVFIMLASLLIASLWDKFPAIKNSVHFILNPTAGNLLNWNLNIGMLIIVVIITLITTIIQKYATDQEALKGLKKEQKEMQKEMKKYKEHPQKLMELQKKQFALMPKQMKLSMRAMIYTGIPFILFFRWFNDYFDSVGEYKLWLGMSWFIFYILGAMIIGTILRKKMDIV